MTRYSTPAKLAIALAAAAGLGAWAFAATPPPNLDAHESALNPGGLDTPDRPAVPLAQQGPTGNPLWGIPLRVLTTTRERPLFSPSRRPPAPPMVAAPVAPPPVAVAKPPEPDHPLLTIVGTIVSGHDAMAVFIEQATNNAIRLHTGQEHDGWVLRAVHGREASFEKKERRATLALPAPGATPGGPTLAGTGQPIQAGLGLPLPTPTPAAAQAGNTWIDGDGQMITPPKPVPVAGRTH
jgi:general secretion pathway protein N